MSDSSAVAHRPLENLAACLQIQDTEFPNCNVYWTVATLGDLWGNLVIDKLTNKQIGAGSTMQRQVLDASLQQKDWRLSQEKEKCSVYLTTGWETEACEAGQPVQPTSSILRAGCWPNSRFGSSTHNRRQPAPWYWALQSIQEEQAPADRVVLPPLSSCESLEKNCRH